ncbi:MAG: AAA family ATPase, partial [Lentisphaeria bacterium]|nr:AAA family ATPase [Lentisphaeria bacterium]
MTTEKEFPSALKTELSTLTIQESGVTREKVLDETQYVIGRGSDCRILLADSNVSRHHAELKFNGSAWVVTDLGSANGTFVNGSPVSAIELKHLDTIQIGNAVLVINEPHRPGEAELWNNEEDPESSGFNFDSMQRVIRRLEENIAQVFKGKPEIIRDLIVCLMADGHLLLEDVPGVGKSLLAQTLAKSVQGRYKRIQFTPDMLPSDITGMNIYDDVKKDFRFLPGPIFGNVILADEINRTTPRTQSSLLECMSESAITIDGRRHVLPKPFFVIATQNPGD